MAKELLLYSSIWDFIVSDLIEKMEEAKAEDIVLRINSVGGGVEDAWGAIAKFEEHAKDKKIKIDGKAFSMAAFFAAYAEDVEALDVSTFIFHRAGFSPWFERDPELMTEELWARVNKINAKLRTALEAKVDVEKFEEVTGVTMDELFSNEQRVNAELTAEEALEVKLINKITPITPEVSAQIESKTMKIAAEANGLKYTEVKKEPESKKPSKTTDYKPTNKLKYKDMSIDKLKAENPDLYKDICEEAVTAEKDRVGAWMAFIDVDKEAVIKGIKEGEALSQTATAEFARKSMSVEALDKVKKDSKEDVETGKPTEKEKTEKEEEVSAFKKDVEKNLGLKKEKKEEDKK